MTSDFRQLLLDEVPDAVIIMTPKGRVVFWNKRELPASVRDLAG